MTNKTLLVVDDQKANRLIVKNTLETDYDILEAENGAQALKIMRDYGEHLSAAVLDLLMPEMSGIELLRQYKDDPSLRRIPVIVVTNDDGGQSEAQCLELGAWDFVRKPLNTKVLRFRIQNAIERNELLVLKKLEYIRQFDELTGIYNKSMLLKRIQEILRRDPDQPYVYIQLDINQFKLINALYGWKEGDRLIRYIADLLASHIADSSREDFLSGSAFNPQFAPSQSFYASDPNQTAYGRIGADVFALCYPYTGDEQLVRTVESIREDINRYSLDYDLVPVFGIYVIRDHNEDIAAISDNANIAAKHCKGNYINNYAIYDPSMSERIVREQMIVNCMKTALEEKQFVLYIQPKYDLHSDSIAGGEVLVRWIDPEKGLISPGDFIPVFERNGFITRLDYYVWEHTCQILRRWIDEGRKPYPVSVNVSRISLYNSKLVDIISELVEKYNIEPRLLQLELTESAYTSNPTAIKEAMIQLQQKGFCILMDDFGSGYSSLNVLKDIAVNILKIDMKFLSDSEVPERGERILAAVMHMANWLKMPVIAEGVEKETQVSFLRSIGCEYAQGYYFAKPMPVEDYEQLLFVQ